jgi:hypothetical protein
MIANSRESIKQKETRIYAASLYSIEIKPINMSADLFYYSN